MSEWKTYKLGEIAETRKEQVVSNGIEQPYIGLEHIEQQSLRLNGLGSSNEVVSNKFKFYNGDILYGRLRPYFRKVYKPKFDGVCSTEIFVIKPKKGIDKNFLFYLVATEEFTNMANSGSSGTHMPRADWKQVEKSEWNIPTLATQTAIAQILTSLDDKIELNLQMNQTLEAMAQAIFKEWFVEFNYPKSSELGLEGLNDDRIIEEEKKKKEILQSSNHKNHNSDKLPKGWRMGKVGEEFNLTMGQSPKGETLNQENEGMIFYQGRTDFGFRFPTNRVFTTEPNRIANKLDTLVCVRAPVGDVNIAIEKCCIGRGLSAVMHKSNAYSYTYYSMKNIEPIFKSFESEGTVFGSLNKNNFENIEITIPSQDLIKEFEKIANSIDEKILNNTLEIQTLTATRDALLPKLMSGKIKVSELGLEGLNDDKILDRKTNI
jgi:type I restriction enzyme S subunit